MVAAVKKERVIVSLYSALAAGVAMVAVASQNAALAAWSGFFAVALWASRDLL